MNEHPPVVGQQFKRGLFIGIGLSMPLWLLVAYSVVRWG